jgi:hypothetical protein
MLRHACGYKLATMARDTAALQPEISVAAATTTRRDAAICRKYPAAEGRSSSPPYAKFERFSRS